MVLSCFQPSFDHLCLYKCHHHILYPLNGSTTGGGHLTGSLRGSLCGVLLEDPTQGSLMRCCKGVLQGCPSGESFMEFVREVLHESH